MQRVTVQEVLQHILCVIDIVELLYSTQKAEQLIVQL